MGVKIKNLNIISVNVNSINRNIRRFILKKFIDSLNPDITLLCEPKLNKKHSISFIGFQIIRSDRPNSKRSGGTAIIEKDSIPFEKIFYRNTEENPTLEACIIKMKNNQNTLYIISMYATNNSRRQVINEINALMNSLKLGSNNVYYIMAGDFNVRCKEWAFVKEWENIQAIDFNARIYTSAEPTFPSAGTYLDIAIIDNRLEIRNLENGKIPTVDYDSDHKGILLKIKINPISINR